LAGLDGPAAAPPQAKKEETVELTGASAVVTGAGSGIGQAVALELARNKVKAIGLADMNQTVNETASLIRDMPGAPAVLSFVGNTTDAAFRRHVFDEMERHNALVNLVVPAAGITRDALSVTLDKTTGKPHIYPEETFRLVLEVNLLAPVYWALEMAARIAVDRHRRGLGRWNPSEHIQGTAIFIGSVSSQGNKGQLAYAATKSGLEGAARTLMKESMFHGVRCSVIHPGFTDTPMVRALGQEYIETKILPFTQLRRLIRPDEIAKAIMFMITNSAMTGELWVDGGWHPSA
jgi:NAD(P)-dependent dehydrogenase (short-subunit alcohol dehydrogenase family)